MRPRLREDPDPDEEPDEDPGDEPALAEEPRAAIPSVAGPGREFEYRTEALSAEQLADGDSLAGLLTRTSAEGWDLVDVIVAGAINLVLLRRSKRSEQARRSVGFMPPAR